MHLILRGSPGDIAFNTVQIHLKLVEVGQGSIVKPTRRVFRTDFPQLGDVLLQGFEVGSETLGFTLDEPLLFFVPSLPVVSSQSWHLAHFLIVLGI
ncbi:hypothetical protein ES705_23438 [subsurface metagenome]